jgi:small-conductance mechanosensitive channel
MRQGNLNEGSIIMRVSSRWVIWLFSAVLLLLVTIALFGSLPERYLGDLGTRMRNTLYVPLLMVGQRPFTLLFLVQIAIFIVALGLISRFAMRILERQIMIHTALAASQQYAVARILSYLIFLLGGLIGLESLGLNLSSLLVVGGALGLGVGLGLQPIVTNFVAGLILLVEQPVRMGDRIELAGLYGDIVAIKSRCTWVKTNENVVIIVPNSEFIEKQVTNWTANDRRVRVAMPVGVSYDSDPEMIREMLVREATGHSDVMKAPAPEVIFLGFGDSTLDFELRIWTEQQVQTPVRLKSDLYYAIFAACRKTGVELAFPQRDLHIRSISKQATEVWLAGIARNSESISDKPDSSAPPKG